MSVCGQGIVIGTAENSEFGDVFKMMQAEEVSVVPYYLLICLLCNHNIFFPLSPLIYRISSIFAIASVVVFLLSGFGIVWFIFYEKVVSYFVNLVILFITSQHLYEAHWVSYSDWSSLQFNQKCWLKRPDWDANGLDLCVTLLIVHYELRLQVLTQRRRSWTPTPSPPHCCKCTRLGLGIFQ